MPDNRQLQDNAIHNPSADNLEEAIWRLKIHDYSEGGVTQSSHYPDRPGEPDCLYYLRTGSCGYGSKCRFNHPTHATQGVFYREDLPERAGQPDCGYFLKTGTCKYGATCKYHHPKDRNGAGPVTFNSVGLPMRKDEKPCPYYMRTGSCKFGVACKFHHPQPAPIGTGNPVNGTIGSSALSSTGLPYVGGLPTWSLPRPPYVSGPRLEGQQGYMPVVVSPSPGVMPAQGWSTYMANMNGVSSAGVLGSNMVYNSINLVESGSSGEGNLSSVGFPDRPDQPECRYFMNTGTCKYGSECKYHHPKERIMQSAPNALGPLGLPSRPGQAVCSSYSMFGLCKYGPTCKFDHPFLGYPYGYGLSFPSLPVLDSATLTYPRMSPAIHLSEASLSSKIPDWAPSLDSGTKKHQKTETKHMDDAAPEQAASPPLHSLKSSHD